MAVITAHAVAIPVTNSSTPIVEPAEHANRSDAVTRSGRSGRYHARTPRPPPANSARLTAISTARIIHANEVIGGSGRSRASGPWVRAQTSWAALLTAGESW